MPDAHSARNAPPGVDLTRPNAARVYDHLLGGSANWAIDREFAARMLERMPLARDMAVANRVFLRRVVRRLAKVGVRQFLDIGAGVPTAGNTHQVADEIDQTTRVVYVDNEPVAVAHAEILLNSEGDPDRHAVINADLRDTDGLWQRAFGTGILDPDQPIAALMIAVMHFHHADPAGNDIGAQCVARYRELLRPGSYLAISHLTFDGIPAEVERQLAAVKQMYDTSVSRGNFRTRAEIDALFGDFELLEPGTVWTPEWHPEEDGPIPPAISFPTAAHAAMWAGVGRKREH